MQQTDRFGVAAPGFHLLETQLLRVSNLNKICHWVELIVMHTARTILRTAFPIMKNWTLSSEESYHRDVDGELFRQIYMINRNSEATPEEYSNTLNPMVVFVQAPWVLSPKDFELFTSRRTVGALKAEPGRRDGLLRSSERLWGKIWDLCVNERCYWFAVTTYEEWAFGRFSDGWTTAFVSPPMSWDSTKPTILQCLTYWMMSSIGAEGTFNTPSVGDLPVKPWTEPYCRLWDLMQIDKRATDQLWRALRRKTL